MLTFTSLFPLIHIYMTKSFIQFDTLRTWTLPTITRMKTALSPKKKSYNKNINNTAINDTSNSRSGNSKNNNRAIKHKCWKKWTDFEIIYEVYSVHAQCIFIHITTCLRCSFATFYCAVGWQTAVSTPV